jgi:hypothetical protein
VNAEEMGELLASAAIYDNRTVGDADILAWMRAIGDLPYGDADAAVAAHYGETTDRLMPAHVRTRVRSARRDRLERAVVPAPDTDPDASRTYRDGLAAMIRRIGDGFSVRKAIGGEPVREGPPPETFTAAKQALPKPPTKAQLAAQQAAESRAGRETAARREAGNAGDQ